MRSLRTGESRSKSTDRVSLVPGKFSSVVYGSQKAFCQRSICKLCATFSTFCDPWQRHDSPLTRLLNQFISISFWYSFFCISLSSWYWCHLCWAIYIDHPDNSEIPQCTAICKSQKSSKLMLMWEIEILAGYNHQMARKSRRQPKKAVIVGNSWKTLLNLSTADKQLLTAFNNSC